jgi:hypothetical protein
MKKVEKEVEVQSERSFLRTDDEDVDDSHSHQSDYEAILTPI